MGTTEGLPRLLAERQAAEYLGIAEVTLRRRRTAGQIGFIRIGRQARYTEHHLLNYLEQQTCQPASAPALLLDQRKGSTWRDANERKQCASLGTRAAGEARAAETYRMT